MILPRELDESLVTGFGELDAQHREMLECANRFIACAESGPPWRGLREAFFLLEQCSRRHHLAEERLMRWLQDPRLPKHLEEHRTYLECLEQFRARSGWAGESRSVIHALSAYLGASLVEHIRRSDKLLAAHAFDHMLSG